MEFFFSAFLFLAALIGALIGGYFLFRNLLLPYYHKEKPIIEYILILAFLAASLMFWGSITGTRDYFIAIDPMDQNYTPLGKKHIATPIVYLLLSFAGIVLLWLRNRKLPPGLFILCISLVIIGMGHNVAILLQLGGTTPDNGYANRDISQFLIWFPAINIIISILVLNLAMRKAADETSHRDYQNKLLRYSKKLLVNIYLQPVWAIALLFPILIVVTVILTLFGQDSHAITKVFTDTTTWHFSKQQHPPFLDHQGHYLCTVAARGHLKIVKPLRFGKRHDNIIIVNRQLMVANAFEQLLQENCKNLHRLTRRLYDKYGYPFSKHICSPLSSDIIYFLMKPIEYFFVLVLYCCCSKPEKRIAAQYLL